mgnify:CR=1 FL=1
MDWVCRSLVDVLGREGGLSLNRLVDKSDFARQTVHNHLKHLMEAGLVSKDVVRGRGRPTMIYRLSKPVEAAVVVSLKFRRLKHACRFEKGGWCKEVKDKCAQENCP